MARNMALAPSRALYPVPTPPAAVPADVRLPRLDRAIEWESRGKQFRGSFRGFFTGPRASRDDMAPPIRALRIDWIEGQPPSRALLASSLWHIALIWLGTLPIWGFLPTSTSTLKPVQIEVTWYVPQDLPSIVLPSTAKLKPRELKPVVADDPKPKVSADAYHPRQTILSIPVRVTHPRQTLIEPEAPPTPPKVAPALPNIVQWPSEQKPKLQLPLAATASTPTIRHEAAKDVAAPELASKATPLEPPPPSVTQPQLRIPVSGGSAPVPRRSAAQSDTAAPEVGSASPESDPGLQRLIALSATPAPPAPEVSIPQGNLAARISISPDGPKSGTSGSAEGRSAIVAASGEGGASGSGGSLPVAVSVSGGGAPAKGGGLGPPGNRAGNLVLKPSARYGPSATSEPARVAAIDPSLPPEKILSGKEVYTLHVNLPNITSVTGSWILSFAQLDADPRPQYRPKGVLAGPVAYEKVDPKYPPGLIKAHVQGEVVLYAIIRKDGSVDSIQLVRGVDPELDRCAIDALAQWKFRPGTRAGVPVDLEAVVHVPFLYKSPQY